MSFTIKEKPQDEQNCKDFTERGLTLFLSIMIFFRMAEAHGLMERLEKAVTRLESLFSDSHRSGGMECDGINGVNGSKYVILKYHLSVIKKFQAMYMFVCKRECDPISNKFCIKIK